MSDIVKVTRKEKNKFEKTVAKKLKKKRYWDEYIRYVLYWTDRGNNKATYMWEKNITETKIKKVKYRHQLKLYLICRIRSKKFIEKKNIYHIYFLSTIYKYEKKYELAILIIDGLKKYKIPEIMFELGMLYNETGQFRVALIIFKKLIDINYTRSYRGLIELYRKKIRKENNRQMKFNYRMELINYRYQYIKIHNNKNSYKKFIYDINRILRFNNILYHNQPQFNKNNEIIKKILMDLSKLDNKFKHSLNRHFPNTK